MKFVGKYNLTAKERQILKSVQKPLVSDAGVRLSKPCVVALELGGTKVYACFTLTEWRRMLSQVSGLDTCYRYELVNLY